MCRHSVKSKVAIVPAAGEQSQKQIDLVWTPWHLPKALKLVGQYYDTSPPQILLRLAPIRCAR